ncbi:radical SAM protein [Desulforhabdus sp. TSK]|uniref:radical SAM protein n=1 Tax=Desulforhabdus sp. TSK TaxID=2925014 RepID=UPI001FC7C246|nr:radical SAM protein [Desulforhabdus sp. TSK]
MKTVFGPVPSRRLGRSLGIDVIPAKTCTYDCVYCESGPTTHLTIRRHSFIDPGRVMHDLESYFHDYPQGADVLTFSSAGEPTLYEPLGQLLGDIKRRFPQLPLVVLTNGSLLWDPRVRQDLSAADRVVPSLDAATLDVFQRINRPHPTLDLPRILEGLQAFRKEYSKQFYLEIMLVAGINDHAEELLEIRRAVDRLRPDRIELNTVVRPPAYGYARGLSGKAMEEVLRFFPAETSGVIGCFEGAAPVMDSQDLPSRVLELVRRRPCTLPEMAASLGVPLESLGDTLFHLLQKNHLIRYRFNDLDYYRPGSAGK